jgi:hypothetical protein
MPILLWLPLTLAHTLTLEDRTTRLDRIHIYDEFKTKAE